MLYLINLKVIFVWVLIVVLLLNGVGGVYGVVVLGCFVIGCVVFGGYVLVFLMDGVCWLYVCGWCVMEVCLVVVFGVVGVWLLVMNV